MDFLEIGFKLRSNDGVYHTYFIPIGGAAKTNGFLGYITQFRIFPAVSNPITSKIVKV